MPRLYKAHHVEVGTEVLLKVVPWSEATAARQDREVRALRVCQHHALPEVLDFGLDPERELVWTAFAWYEAEPLGDRMLGEGVDWRDGCRMVREIADALLQVHEDGYVHRDIRPATIAIERQGKVWLTGFDYAMTQEELEQLRQAPFGDIAYLAPEVLADPTHHGPRADVYAVGCVLYEVLTGQSAFPAAAWGERPDQAARMLEWKSKAEPLQVPEDCPLWLGNLIAKCTDPDPDRRLPDVEALAGWLDAAQAAWEPPKSKAPPKVTMRPPRIAPKAIAPSIAGPSRPRSTPRRPAPPPPQRLPAPVPVLYFGAATLGCLCALGFSALLILFVEVQRGTL
jgi:serine/threonine protein kinase